MKALRITLTALSLSAISSLALAAGSPLSVHVLNLENGLPSQALTSPWKNTLARTGSRWHRV